MPVVAEIELREIALQMGLARVVINATVLIAGSTGSALRAVRPPYLHITPVARRDLVYRASATGSLYRSPLAIIAQTIRAILLASAIAATLVGRRANATVTLHGEYGHGVAPLLVATLRALNIAFPR